MTELLTRGWTAGAVVTSLFLCAAAANALPPPVHRANDDEVEVAYLIKLNTADSLATASLFTHLVDTASVLQAKPDSTALIDRAVALAPGRPELVWLKLRDCEMTRCAQRASIAATLHELDPNNAAVRLSALNTPDAQQPAAATQIIADVAKGPELRIYWNKLLVMMFEATTHGAATKATALTAEADDRLAHCTGVLTAISIAPFKPLSILCKSDQFAESGRRAACEALMPRLDEADSVIAQALSPNLQEGWYSPGTPQNKLYRAKHLQLTYLVQESNRSRGDRTNDDANLRVDAMRRLPREADVEVAMLHAFNEPIDRPDDWSSPATAQ